MPESTTDEVIVSSRVATAYEQLAQASAARLRWEAEEKRMKAVILEELGYDDNDPKPVPVKAVDPSGHPLFEVKIGTWRGLDQKYLKAKYPDVYAECENTKPTRIIRGLLDE